MATTTNYGWTTPDDTALVKDGASAIRTLGSSVDTTTKALNPSTTLGDIEYRSSTANTNTRLGIGSTGNVLTVSGGVPTWAAPAAGGMTLINTGGTTLTGAEIVISSIPSTYIHLNLLLISPKPATDDVYWLVRFNGDSNANRYKTIAAIGAGDQSFSQSSMALGEGQDNTNANGSASISIPNYAQTGIWKMASNDYVLANNGTTSTNFNTNKYYGFYNQTDAITSITIRPSSGNWTSGTAFLYGVK